MLFDIALVAPRLGALGSQFDRRRPGRPGVAACAADIDSFFANSDGVRGLAGQRCRGAEDFFFAKSDRAKAWR